LKALFLTRYGRLAASSRQRCFLYLDALRGAGIEPEVSPFLSDDYVRRLNCDGARSMVAVVQAYVSRVRVLLGLRRYDIVWLEKETLPWIPAWVELAFLRLAGIRTVVDYDDAVYHAYDQNRFGLVRKLFGRKIDRVMAFADLVTVGNSYLGLRAKAAGARAVVEIPTAVDLRRYPQRCCAAMGTDGPLTLGWIGSSLTSSYLEMLRAPLAELAGRLSIKIVLIGAAAGALAELPVERVPWSEETEAAELARCDVGLMPLPDLPFERGKCGYKLIQYMASGLPVVASPVGINCEIVIPGETGFLAETKADWVSSLIRLARDPELRQRMGIAGRRRAEAHYSLDATAPKLIGPLRSVGVGNFLPAESMAPSGDVLPRAAVRREPL
jgi:glycosyltransferase involved in cell wall biosynthesis